MVVRCDVEYWGIMRVLLLSVLYFHEFWESVCNWYFSASSCPRD